MQFIPPLQQGVFLRRYKRFLADIVDAEGNEVTIHCSNTGSMKNCLIAASPCWYSISANPQRKYPYTWELATTPSGHLAGINTARANGLVAEAIANGVIAPLQGYEHLQPEVIYGQERSRADFVLTHSNRPRCVVEVKSVTLLDFGAGYFPDSVSERGSKHLRELMQVALLGERAVLVFCVQHEGISSVAPAAHIDAEYTRLCSQAVSVGVEFYAYGAELSCDGITLSKQLPVII